MNTVYRLWSEWDIGEGSLVFATKEAGEAWLRNNSDVKDIADAENQTLEDCITDCFENGYFSWEKLVVTY